jgi:hypothetical protein
MKIIGKFLIPLLPTLFGIIILSLLTFCHLAIYYQSIFIPEGPCSFSGWTVDKENQNNLAMKIKFKNGKEGYTKDKIALIFLENPNIELMGSRSRQGEVRLKLK